MLLGALDAVVGLQRELRHRRTADEKEEQDWGPQVRHNTINCLSKTVFNDRFRLGLEAATAPTSSSFGVTGTPATS